MATDPCSTVFWFTDLSINGPSTTISSTTVCSITFCWPKNWTSDLQYVSDKTYVQRSLQLCYSAAKILTRWKLRWDEIFFFFSCILFVGVIYFIYLFSGFNFKSTDFEKNVTGIFTLNRKQLLFMSKVIHCHQLKLVYKVFPKISFFTIRMVRVFINVWLKVVVLLLNFSWS